MSGNSCFSALQTAPIVSDFCRAGLGAAVGGVTGGAAACSAPACSAAAGGMTAACDSAGVPSGVTAESRDLRGHDAHRDRYASLYLPTCNSSPSSRRCDSIRSRLT